LRPHRPERPQHYPFKALERTMWLLPEPAIVRQTVRVIKAGLRGDDLTIACGANGADNAD